MGFDNDGVFHGASVAIPSQDLNSWVFLAGTFDGQTWRAVSRRSTGCVVRRFYQSHQSDGQLGHWRGNDRARSSNAISAGRSTTCGFTARPSSSAGIAGLEAGPPTVATPAAASPGLVTGTTTALSVLGNDDAGASALTYTWSTTGTPPAAVSFSANGTNAAASTTATFTAAGTYNFLVTITDPAGLTATSSVTVTVDQTLTSIAVSPASVGLSAAATQQFTATALDQFGAALATQPAFTWTTTVGTISAAGLLTASDSSLTGTVTAGYLLAGGGTISGTSAVTVTDHVPTVAIPAAATPATVTGTTTSLSGLGADIDTGEGSLIYSWAATTLPGGAAAPTFSPNGNNAAQNSVATFHAAGAYVLTETILDPGGLSVTSSVNVTVDQVFTAVAVTPATDALTSLSTQQFTAAANDQFGKAMASGSAAWTVTAGSITNSGLFTPPFASGTVTVTATIGSASGMAVVNVDQVQATPSPVIGTTMALSVLGPASLAERRLVYSWAATTLPSGAAAPTFSVNGSNAAKNTTATVSAAGFYVFTATISEGAGQTTTSSLDVTVNQTLTSITAQPQAATAWDQFGNPLASQPTFIAGSDTISSPLPLENNLTVLPAAGSRLTISAAISGAGQSLTINGPGTVVLAGMNSYTGGTTITAGTLILTNASAIAANTSLMVGAEAAFLFAAPAAAAASPASSLATSSAAIATSLECGACRRFPQRPPPQ